MRARSRAILFTAWLAACDETAIDERAERSAAAPTPTTEIEVSSFEDHGVRLDLRLATQYCHEGVNRALSGNATANDEPMNVGDRGQARVWAGPFVDGAWSLADGLDGYGAGDGEAMRNIPAPHHWHIDAERLASDRPDQYRFAVTWEHLLFEREGAVPRRTGDTRIITLADEEHHVLDFLALPRDAEGCDHALVIDVIAVPEEPAELSARRLRYDVWHVHTLPDGTETAAQVGLAAGHGAAVDFTLPELRPQLSEPLMLDEVAYEMVLLPSGSLRGRVRTDGDVDLVIEAQLGVAMVEVGQPESGWGASRGTHAFRVGPGQTLRLELPDPSGTATRSVGDERHTVAERDVLGDHADALLVTVNVD